MQEFCDQTSSQHSNFSLLVTGSELSPAAFGRKIYHFLFSLADVPGLGMRWNTEDQNPSDHSGNPLTFNCTVCTRMLYRYVLPP